MWPSLVPGQYSGLAEVPQFPSGPSLLCFFFFFFLLFFCSEEPICEFCACWHLRNNSFVLCWRFFFSKPSFTCISITDEIVGVMKDELPEARFVAADNIVDSSWKGEGISGQDC